LSLWIGYLLNEMGNGKSSSTWKAESAFGTIANACIIERRNIARIHKGHLKKDVHTHTHTLFGDGREGEMGERVFGDGVRPRPKALRAL